MTENALTFSELRKIQKEENREEEITELGEDFLLRVSNYLQSKKEASNDDREYKNARRVFKKIISLREDKIVKNAKISVKAENLTSDDKMLPREKELYRQLKQVFQDHRDRIDDIVKGDEAAKTKFPENDENNSKEEKDSENGEEDSKVKDDVDTDEKKETDTEDSEEESDIEDGYMCVEITSEVPEFMGTDLETYGPFDEGETAELPEDNAEILVNRGNAEEV